MVIQEKKVEQKRRWRREYQRRWRLAHPEEKLSYRNWYLARDKDKLRVYMRELMKKRRRVKGDSEL